MAHVHELNQHPNRTKSMEFNNNNNDDTIRSYLRGTTY